MRGAPQAVLDSACFMDWAWPLRLSKAEALLLFASLGLGVFQGVVGWKTVN